MALRARLQADKALGCEYATFQMHLPPSYMNTGGAYRQVSHGLHLPSLWRTPAAAVG